jgi:kumamolisin
VGNINARLYALGPLSNTSSSGLHDVTIGNNSFNGVPGYSAKPGYDRATGWGTPDIAILVPLLGP